MKKIPTETPESKAPVVVWLDDSMEEWDGNALLRRATERLSDVGISFEAAVFTRTDDAVQFIVDNPGRVFMVIQDTFRDEGVIVPGWKALRPSKTPPVGFRSLCGDFSTYVMDAFAPEATQVYYGGFYSEEELRFLETWGRADPRIVVSHKGFSKSFLFGGEQDLWIAQWTRWHSARNPRDLSNEGRLLQLVADEMAILCSAKPEYIEKLAPRQFEELIAALFKNQGFTVHLTARTRDGGYDIAAVDHSKLPEETILVEVKHFAPHRPVGVGIVRALYGVKTLRGASRALLATSSYVSKDAKREFSRVIPWELEVKEGKDIIDWCRLFASSVLQENYDAENAE